MIGLSRGDDQGREVVTPRPGAVAGVVRELATLLRWRCYAVHDTRRSPPGWPDLVLCRPPEIIFAELKTDRGGVPPAQREWLNDLAAKQGGNDGRT